MMNYRKAIETLIKKIDDDVLLRRIFVLINRYIINHT